MGINFFNPVVESIKFHMNFLQMLEDQQDEIRDLFNKWAEGLVDRDGKLVKEFQTTFNSTFWEVYLYAILKEGGLKCDFTIARPDFIIKNSGYEFCIEAVVSNAARGDRPEWHKDTFKEGWKPPRKNNVDYASLNRYAMIRHSNAIQSKYELYKKKYCCLDHAKGKPFVIALGAYDNPNSWEEMNRAIMAVLYDYYIDEQDAFAGEVLHYSPFPVKTLGKVKKDNGSDVCLGLFNSPKMKEISAVIFSCTATMGKLRALVSKKSGFNIFSYHWMTPGGQIGYNSLVGDECLGDGLMVFHNPFAEIPLLQDPLEIPGVSHYYFDIEGKNDYVIATDGPMLMARANIHLNVTKDK